MDEVNPRVLEKATVLMSTEMIMAAVIEYFNVHSIIVSLLILFQRFFLNYSV